MTVSAGVAIGQGAPDRALVETGAYKWYVAVALCAAHAVSLIDRFVIVLVNEPLRHAMGLTDAQLGLLQGTGFALLYCAFALPLGSVADTLNRRNLIIIGLLFWSAATIAAAFTNSFETLFATRVLVGMGEACLIPAAMSLLAAYFAPSKLARGTAIFGMGANFGYGIAFIGGGMLLAAINAAGGLNLPGTGMLAPWQGVFFCAGLSAAPALFMLLWIKEPPRAGVSGSLGIAAQFSAMRTGVRYITRNIRKYLPFLVVAAATSASGYALNSWSTSLWTRLHGLSPAEAGQIVGLIGIVAGPLGTAAGGIALDRLQARGTPGAPLVIMAVGAVSMIGIVAGFTMVSGQTAASVFFSLFVFESFFMLPSTYVGMQLLTPDAFRGMAAAFNMMIYTLCGLGVGPAAVGIISDMLSGPEKLGTAVLLFEAVVGGVIVSVALASRKGFHEHARSRVLGDGSGSGDHGGN